MYLKLRAYLAQKKPVAQNYPFYRNILYPNSMYKNVSCDMGLIVTSLTVKMQNCKHPSYYTAECVTDLD